LGFSGERTAQNRGKTGKAGDIDILELPNIHFESKHDESFDVGVELLEKALNQAENDASHADKPKFPVVFWKRNHVKFRMTFRAELVENPGDAPHRYAVTVTDPQAIRIFLLKTQLMYDNRFGDKGASQERFRQNEHNPKREDFSTYKVPAPSLEERKLAPAQTRESLEKADNNARQLLARSVSQGAAQLLADTSSGP
jgi:hypothetical protein